MANSGEIGDESKASSAEMIIAPKHPLQNDWQLWYWKKDDSRSWEDSLLEVTSFSTVEDFWALYNHIELASKLGLNSDYSVFKSGIKPMWEDPRNSRGGRWLMTLDNKTEPQVLDDMWLEVLLCLIGESFGDESDQICGATINIRRNSKIGIWTADHKQEDAIKKIGQTIKDRTNFPGPIVYEKHGDSTKGKMLYRI